MLTRFSSSTPTGPQTRPSILMLDDDPFMLGMQSRILRGMGYQTVSTASSGEAALKILLAEASAIDIIVCDLNMPGMDGIDFLQNLNAAGYCGTVILLSGEGARIMHTVQKLLGGKQLVILGALEKPVGRAALRALLDRWAPPSEFVPGPARLAFSSAELHAANRERQWILHYQPKVNLKTGVLTGMEALVRWNHPQHGLVPPDQFISIAEDCGALDVMTEWVLHEAMQQLARWQGQGLPMQMAVNLSAENLSQPGFARVVAAMASAASVSPRDVTLEITESRLMSPSLVPLENLARLRMLRFGLSIDDFGTGHSSLAQLRDVPFTELKIDRGFVQGARYNQIIRPILEGSIGIAAHMGMQSVAEGVETEDDWQLLREIGCDLAQGYFIGRPMTADRMPEWHTQWQARCLRLIES